MKIEALSVLQGLEFVLEKDSNGNVLLDDEDLEGKMEKAHGTIILSLKMKFWYNFLKRSPP